MPGRIELGVGRCPPQPDSVISMNGHSSRVALPVDSQLTPSSSPLSQAELSPGHTGGPRGGPLPRGEVPSLKSDLGRSNSQDVFRLS